ncbi:hypothetical protein BBJ28_00013211 [Nothophytophthora sp. Chile5]|nr:hypothetical protein BBJ28_00013211 [Nothophytophthora sp. Chile5]
MGRTGAKIQKGGLGKALLKTQKKSSATNTTDVQSRCGDDFLASAVLANREFTAVKESIMLLEEADTGAQLVEYVHSNRPRLRINDTYSSHFIPASRRKKNVVPEMTFAELKVPRRPQWDASTTADELNQLEKESFLTWRRDIALLEASSDNLEVTPFEKNLEVWRQLWHVRERSDIMVQIVDARNPLFYRSTWGDHFKAEKIDFVFFSAKEAQDEIDEDAKKLRIEQRDAGDYESYEDAKPASTPQPEASSSTAEVTPSEYPVLSRLELLDFLTTIATEVASEVGLRVKDKGLIKFGMVGFPNVGKSSVINALLGASTYSHKTQRVAVGATPGKTKHFQTLILSDKIMLCDCPGLVFPSFVNSKAEMYCCGVLPISQLRDHIGTLAVDCLGPNLSSFAAVDALPNAEVSAASVGAFVQHRVSSCATASRSACSNERTASRFPPRKRRERLIPSTSMRFWRYVGVTCSHGLPHATDRYFLGGSPCWQSYARNRGYTTTGKGGPDTSRAARDILRHYVNGRLLYCHPAPNASDPRIFDIHALAKAQFPDLEEPIVPVNPEDGDGNGETNAAAGENADEDLDFDTTGEDKRAMSKRLKKHGRKGRKGRDKNPYEDSDLPSGIGGVHINSGGKKKDRKRQ